jgi:hypothetical protein
MISLFILKLAIWSIAIYGITQIITEATIFKWLRDYFTQSKNKISLFFGKLITCFLCASVWISFILSGWVFSPSTELWTDLSIVESIFIDGMIGSTIVWFLHLYESKLN